MFKVETQVSSQVLQSFGHHTQDLSAQPTRPFNWRSHSSGIIASSFFYFFIETLHNKNS